MPDTIKELTNILALSAGPMRALWDQNPRLGPALPAIAECEVAHICPL
jgi:hypothetical protein